MGKSSEMAECSIIVEHSIERNDIEKNNLYWFSSKAETRQLNPLALWRVAMLRGLPELGSGFPKPILDSCERKANEELGRLEAQGMGELASCIAEGRVRLSLLLDTYGGEKTHLDRIKDIKKFLMRSGGEFIAFGGYNVQSLGADLLMVAAKGDRYVHPLSRIVFHLGEANPIQTNHLQLNHPELLKTKKEVLMDQKSDMEELRSMFMEEVTRERRKEMAEWLKTNLLAKRPKSKDRPVNLSGKAMDEWGMAKALMFMPMWQEYLRRHRIQRESVQGTPIEYFFGHLQRCEQRYEVSQNKMLLDILQAGEDRQAGEDKSNE